MYALHELKCAMRQSQNGLMSQINCQKTYLRYEKLVYLLTQFLN